MIIYKMFHFYQIVLMLFMVSVDGYVSLSELPKLSQSPLLLSRVNDLIYKKSDLDTYTFDIQDAEMHHMKNIKPAFNMSFYGIQEQDVAYQLFSILDFEVNHFKDFRQKKYDFCPTMYFIYPTVSIASSLIPTTMTYNR